MSATRYALLAAALAPLAAAQTAAQTPAQPSAPDAHPLGDAFPTWTFEIEPSAWFVAPGGKGRLPGSSSTSKFEDLNLDSPRASPQLEARFRSGKWGVQGSGMHFKIDDRSAVQSEGGTLGDVAFSPGDTLTSSFEFTSIELMGSYQLFGETLSFRDDGKRKFGYSLDALLGARYYRVEQGVQSVSASDSASGTWIEPVAGARLEMEFHEFFTLDVRTNVGYLPAGDNESLSWDIAVGGTFRPIENVGVQVGYRQLLVHLKDGGSDDRFEFRGAMAGLYLGASFRF